MELLFLIFPLNARAQLYPETGVGKKSGKCFAFIFCLGRLPSPHASPVLRAGVPCPERHAPPWPPATICVREQRRVSLGGEILENVCPWLVDT